MRGQHFCCFVGQHSRCHRPSEASILGSSSLGPGWLSFFFSFGCPAIHFNPPSSIVCGLASTLGSLSFGGSIFFFGCASYSLPFPPLSSQRPIPRPSHIPTLLSHSFQCSYPHALETQTQTHIYLICSYLLDTYIHMNILRSITIAFPLHVLIFFFFMSLTSTNTRNTTTTLDFFFFSFAFLPLCLA